MNETLTVRVGDDVVYERDYPGHETDLASYYMDITVQNSGEKMRAFVRTNPIDHNPIFRTGEVLKIQGHVDPDEELFIAECYKQQNGRGWFDAYH